VGKAEEVERVRFPVYAFLPVSSRERSEFQSRFLGTQFQAGTSAFLLDRFRPERAASDLT
jgi:hypothetical protein